MKKISQWFGIVRLFFITVDISIRTVVQHWRGPQKMTREWSDKTIQNWASRLLNAAQVNLHVHKLYPIQLESGRPYIIMCNHTSHFDIPISLVALSGWSVRMMAKKELYRIPIFGKAMSSADFPIIDRNNRRQSLKDMAYAEKLMKTGIMVWVAPEGTRSPTQAMGEFKRGAFIMAINTQAMIIPIGIRGAGNILPTKSLHLNFGEKIDVTIGQPIDAAEYTLKEKDVLLHRVKEAIAELIQ